MLFLHDNNGKKSDRMRSILAIFFNFPCVLTVILSVSVMIPFAFLCADNAVYQYKTNGEYDQKDNGANKEFALGERFYLVKSV